MQYVRGLCVAQLTHELSKAAQGKPAGSSDKLHEAQSHFVVHFFHELHAGKEGSIHTHHLHCYIFSKLVTPGMFFVLFLVIYSCSCYLLAVYCNN